MANSSAVSSGDLATADQYNNLRDDVVSTCSGHLHDGTNGRGDGAFTLQVSGVPLTIENSTDGTSNQVMLLRGDNATRADGDEIYMSFNLDDDGGNTHEFARITAEAVDVSNGSEDGQIRFGVSVAGTMTDVFEINSSIAGATSISYEVDAFTIKGEEGGAGVLYLFADQGDDAGDEWKINIADGGVMTFGNDIASAGSYVTHMTLTPHATIASSSVTFPGIVNIDGSIDADVTDVDVASSGDIDLTSTANSACAIYLRANGGTSETIKIHSDQGTSESSIQLLSDAGGVDINAATGKDVDIAGGTINLTSSDNAGSAVYIRANAGTSETIKIHADQGNGEGSIELTSDAGGIDINANAAKDIDLAGGQINLTGSHNTACTIYLRANAGTSETIKIHADQGTAVTEGAASVSLLSDAGGVELRSTADLANAINITNDGGTSGTIAIFNDQGTSVTEGAESISLLSDVGGVGIRSTANLANAVNITADGGSTSTIQIYNDQGTSVTEGAASVAIVSDAGGVELRSTANLANAINITNDGGTSGTISIFNDLGSSVTEGAESISLLSDAGGVGIRSTANLANAVNITVDGGSTSTMTLFNDQGTSVTEGAASIELLSDAGGVELRSTANLANAINLTSDGGTSGTITLFNDQGTAVNEGVASIQLLSDVGGIGIKSGLNAAGAIRLTADAGTSETIMLHADQGNGTGSICLTSDAGGITLNPATFVTVGGNATNAGEIRLFEDNDHGCNYVAIKPGNVTGSYTMTLPTAVAASCGLFLKSTCAGVLSWAAAGGGCVVCDTSPQLGGSLDAQTETIVNIGNASNDILATGVRTVNGCSCTPSYSFTSATNDGMFLAADDHVAISSGGTHRFSVHGSHVRVTANGRFFVSDCANADGSIDATINQLANDNHILTLKSSTVAQQYTDAAEADTYAAFKKASASAGGLHIRGFRDADCGAVQALMLEGFLGEAACTSDSSGNYGLISLRGRIVCGSGATAMAATGNLLSVDNSSTTRLILKGNGVLHLTSTSLSALDDYPDALMGRVGRVAFSPECSCLRKTCGHLLEERPDLIEVMKRERILIHEPCDPVPCGFISVQKGITFGWDMAYQNWQAISSQEQRLNALETELKALQGGCP